MSNAPEGTATTPVVADGPEGGNDDEEERVEEIVVLRTCHPKPRGRSLDYSLDAAALPGRPTEARCVYLLRSAGPLPQKKHHQPHRPLRVAIKR